MLTTTTIQRSAHRSLITSYPRKLTRQQGAFTIVELLLVIVIIAILAAITIVAFNGIQDRARASAVSAALNQASKKLELYSVDNGGYPAALSDAGVTDSNNVSYQYTASTAPSATYCTTATQGSTSYYISNTTKTPTKGGCPGHGQGGVAAITNLAIYPQASTNWYGGYGAGGAGSASVISDARFPGGTAYRLTWTTAPTSSSSLFVGANANTVCTAGHTYFLAMRYVASWSGSQPYIYLAGPNSSAAVAVTSRGDGTYDAKATWTPSSCAPFKPLIALGAGTTLPAVSSTWIVGGLMIVDTQGATTYNYADGSSPNWVWNGATNASTSTGPPL